MFKCDERKLTPVDVQVLNMLALTGDLVRPSFDVKGGGITGAPRRARLTGFSHPTMGAYTRSLFGLQRTPFNDDPNPPGSSSPPYRRLSWRGQILLARWWREHLSSAIPDTQTSTVTITRAQQAAAVPPPYTHGPLQAWGQAALEQAQRPMTAMTAAEIQMRAAEQRAAYAKAALVAPSSISDGDIEALARACPTAHLR